MIVGGYDNQLSSVEVLDENQHFTCNIPFPPLDTVWSSTVTSTGILVCGDDECYEYNSNIWKKMPSMIRMRVFESAIDMIYLRGKVYAVGHRIGIFDTTTSSWSSRQVSNLVDNSLVRQLPSFGHCITQLSANEFIVIGGYGYDGVSKNLITKKIFQSNNSIFFAFLCAK